MTNMQELRAIASDLRKELIVGHSKARMAHIGSDFSCLDIMVALYFKIMGPDDKFVLSKGHAALGLYAVLHRKGIMSDKVYATLGENGSMLGEHPIQGIEGIDFATGSLGHGLSLGAGLALSKRYDRAKGRVYVLLSDGECQEGSTLEAMNFIGRMQLNNVVAIVDSNRWQAFDRTLIPIDVVKNEFKSAGWKIIDIDGHNYDEINAALSKRSSKPILIAANTVLGKGIKTIEDRLEAHYRPPKPEEVEKFISEIE